MRNISDDQYLVSLRLMHPLIDNSSLSTFTGAYKLSFAGRISQSIGLIAEVPVIGYASTNSFGDSYSGSALGNILLGVQTLAKHSGTNSSNFSFAVVLPTSSAEKMLPEMLLGMLTSPYDMNRYIPESFSIYTNAAFRKDFSRSFLSVEAGPEVVMSTNENNSGTISYVHFGLKAGLSFSRVLLSSEFYGLLLLSNKTYTFSERFNNMFSIGGTYLGTSVRPSVFYQFYLNEGMSNMLNGAFGVRMDFAL